MSLSLIVVALGALAAAAGTGVLVTRCARMPRAYYFAWALALSGLAVALGSQFVGDLAGYDDLLFRAMELGAQMIAPLALCLSLAEVVGRTVQARFAMRLAVSAIAVIAVVVLGTDPLSLSVPFSTTWPDPAVFYQLWPKGVLDVLACFTLGAAVVAAGVMLTRSRDDDGAKEATRPAFAACAAAALLAVPGLVWLVRSAVGVSLPLAGRSGFALACTGAAVLTWLAGRQAARLDRAGAPVIARAGESDRDDDWPEPDTGIGRWVGSHRDQRDEAGRAWAKPDDRPFGDGSEVRYPGLAALAADTDRSHGRYDDLGWDDDYSERHGDGYSEDYSEPGRPYGRDSYKPPRDTASPAELFGQITIYTLIEDRTSEFDRLTERVVAQVQEQEPSTLAYIVHAVPTAPMQRILYEVYRDQGAYDSHMSQPYIARYEVERRPLVLATNVIELGLQQAKVSAFPSFSAISDILSESGIDLTGVTRSPRDGGPPTGVPGGRPPGPAQDPEYQYHYRGWDEIRGEEERYR